MCPSRHRLRPQLAPPLLAPTRRTSRLLATLPSPSAPCSATADPGPLNRAEWVKYAGAFFNKEIDANRIYAGIKVRRRSLGCATTRGRTCS